VISLWCTVLPPNHVDIGKERAAARWQDGGPPHTSFGKKAFE